MCALPIRPRRQRARGCAAREPAALCPAETPRTEAPPRAPAPLTTATARPPAAEAFCAYRFEEGAGALEETTSLEHGVCELVLSEGMVLSAAPRRVAPRGGGAAVAAAAAALLLLARTGV